MKIENLNDEIVLEMCLRENGTKMKSVVSSQSWLKNHSEISEYLQHRFSDSESIGETLYRIKYKLEIRPVCSVCGKPVRFVKFHKGFAEHCSIECLNKDPNHINRCAETCTKKYGGPSSMCAKETQQKSKETCLKKYGVEFSLQSTEVRQKGFETCLQKYGKKMYGTFGSEEYNALIKERYGVDNVFQSEIIKNKIKETNKQKYGAEYASQTEEVKQKAKNTCLQKYGVENYMQLPESRAKTGYIFSRPEVRLKVKETVRKKYGVEFVSQSPIFKDKFKATCLKKYGVEHVLQNPKFLQKVLDTKRKNNSFNVSKLENGFKEYLLSKGFEIKTQYVSDLYPFHCDFYIPSLDLYIEINGTWTHGKHRFNPENEDDRKLVEYWRSKGTPFYASAITTWTISDIKKFETAEKNNLKYLAIYSNKLKECVTQFENFINQP